MICLNKERVIFLLVLFLLSGCSFKKDMEKLEDKKSDVKDEIVNDNEVVDDYVDSNPIKLGMYVHQNGIKNLTSVYDSSFAQYQDIVSFEVYYTTEELLKGNQKTLWSNYYSNYQEDISFYKIGYNISFETLSQGKIVKNILSPDDVNDFFDYVQVYLYDDINQTSSWYSHITQSDMTDNTILTSIKLTASTKIDEITGPITLTAFTYDLDDFDEFGNYKGNSTYRAVIQRD